MIRLNQNGFGRKIAARKSGPKTSAVRTLVCSCLFCKGFELHSGGGKAAWAIARRVILIAIPQGGLAEMCNQIRYEVE